MYFTRSQRGETQGAESSVKIYAGENPITLDITASGEDMDRLLSLPIEELGSLSFAEIGSILGRTENWARVTYYRAKQQLIKEMKQS